MLHDSHEGLWLSSPLYLSVSHQNLSFGLLDVHPQSADPIGRETHPHIRVPTTTAPLRHAMPELWRKHEALRRSQGPWSLGPLESQRRSVIFHEGFLVGHSGIWWDIIPASIYILHRINKVHGCFMGHTPFTKPWTTLGPIPAKLQTYWISLPILPSKISPIFGKPAGKLMQMRQEVGFHCYGRRYL
jgi:hypothetical protein